MKVLKNFLMLFSFLFIISCSSTKIERLNFHNKSGSVLIQNETNEDVVIFIGKIANKKILGGVKANSDNYFDINSIEGIPNYGAFVTRCILYSDFIEKTNLTEDDVFYQMVVTFDSNDPSYSAQFNIPNIIDTSRECGVIVRNDTRFIMEVRYGHPRQGQIVATLLPFELNKKVYLKSEDRFPIDIYPVYRYIDSGKNESYVFSDDSRFSCMPDLINNYPVILSFRFPKIDLDKIIHECELEIRNETEHGFQLRNGTAMLPNIQLKYFSQPGKTDYYEISEGEHPIVIHFDNDEELEISQYPFNGNHKYLISVYVSQLTGEFEYEIKDMGSIERKMNLLFE